MLDGCQFKMVTFRDLNICKLDPQWVSNSCLLVHLHFVCINVQASMSHQSPSSHHLNWYW